MEQPSQLLKLARKPVVRVSRADSVMHAVRVMMETQVGAALVIEDGHAMGVFTERDVMAKVVARKLDPDKTPISEVMTSPVLVVAAKADPADALQLMIDRHIRHLPLVDDANRVIGILSMRHLMRERIAKLEQEASALENYIGSEGISGG